MIRKNQDGRRSAVDDHNSTRNTQHSTLGSGGLLVLLAALAFTAVVYAPLLDNYFNGDDFLNLYRIVNFSLFQYLLTPHGGHALVLRNFLFYACFAAFGTNPEGYFWVVLLNHLANVVLLFLVVRTLTQSPALAGFGAALFGTSPICAGTLGWYAVYGQVVVATAMLLILYILARAAATGRAPSRGQLARCYMLGLLAVVSFGVGIGLAMALPFVVAWLTPAARQRARWGLPLASLLLVVPLVYVCLFWLHGLWFGEGLETPQTLVKYATELWMTVIPGTVHLIAYGTVRLLCSFAFNSEWFTTATSYCTFAALALISLVGGWRAPSEVRRTLAASALLVVANYVLIAMGRAVFFQAYSSAVVAIQPRYHYSGLVPLTLLICTLLNRVPFPSLGASFRALPSIAGIGLVVLLYRAFGFHIDNHALTHDQVDGVLKAVATSAAAVDRGGDVYIPNRSFGGLLGMPPAQFPGWAAVFVIFNRSPVIDGRRVYFVDRRPEVIAACASGKRTAGLLVPPPEKPKPATAPPRPPLVSPKSPPQK